jgi:poly(3-hydroxybutyrate) depolymerase
MDNGGNLVYQVKAAPSMAMIKALAIVASSPPDDVTTTW